MVRQGFGFKVITHIVILTLQVQDNREKKNLNNQFFSSLLVHRTDAPFCSESVNLH